MKTNMGFFDRFRPSPQEMGIKPDEENKQEQAVQAEAPVEASAEAPAPAAAEAPKAQIVPELGMTQEEFDKLTPEEQAIQKGRVHNVDDAQTEAAYTNATAGSWLRNAEKQRQFAEKIGQEPSWDKEGIEKQASHIAERGEEIANLTIKESLDKNIDSAPVTLAGGSLSEVLRQDESLLLKSVKDVVGVPELEVIAAKVGRELQTLEEPGPSGNKKYDVAVIDETNDYYTMITNGDGSFMDKKPRVFKISKTDFAGKGYSLHKNTDYKSIFGEAQAAKE